MKSMFTCHCCLILIKIFKTIPELVISKQNTKAFHNIQQVVDIRGTEMSETFPVSVRVKMGHEC